MPKHVRCAACHGTGKINTQIHGANVLITCPTCGGNGYH